jgi:hypothetical protein
VDVVLTLTAPEYHRELRFAHNPPRAEAVRHLLGRRDWPGLAVVMTELLLPGEPSVRVDVVTLRNLAAAWLYQVTEG